MIHEMTLAPQLDGRLVVRVGRKHKQHLLRVLIEDNAVVVRTRCGIILTGHPEGFTETHGVPTCEACIDDEIAQAERMVDDR